MRGGKDRGADHDPADPTISLTKALKEKASEKDLFYDRGEHHSDQDEPCRRIEFSEDLQDFFPLRIHAKRHEDQIMQNNEHIGGNYQAASYPYNGGLECTKSQITP